MFQRKSITYHLPIHFNFLSILRFALFVFVQNAGVFGIHSIDSESADYGNRNLIGLPFTLHLNNRVILSRDVSADIKEWGVFYRGKCAGNVIFSFVSPPTLLG